MTNNKSKSISNSSKSASHASKLVAPASKDAIEKMKYEIANEFGVKLGADATARANGSVGGEITRRLVEMGHTQLKGSSSKKTKN